MSYKSRTIQKLFTIIMSIIILLQKLHLDSSKKKKNTINLTLFQTLVKYYIQLPKKKRSNVNKRRKNVHCIFRQLTFLVNKVRLQSDMFFRLFHIVNINMKKCSPIGDFYVK